MNTCQRIRFMNLVTAGFIYPGMTLIVPMAGGGASLVAVVFAPITLCFSLLCASFYYLFIRWKKLKFASFFFWLVLPVILAFTFLTFPYH